MLADSDGPTFGDEHRTEQHAALGADGHVAANGGGGCDIGGLVDAGSFGLMFKQLSLEMACGRRARWTVTQPPHPPAPAALLLAMAAWA